VSEPDAWKDVMPTDKELVKFLKWKWAFEERKLWIPGTGVTGNVDIGDLEQLIEELRK
jgi:methyl-CpG-binding domain protein 4